jgi:hypothetical protein
MELAFFSKTKGKSKKKNNQRKAGDKGTSDELEEMLYRRTTLSAPMRSELPVRTPCFAS